LSIAKDAIVGARLEGRAVMHETAFRRSKLHILETRAMTTMERPRLAKQCGGVKNLPNGAIVTGSS
jgi:hypothetical protein